MGYEGDYRIDAIVAYLDEQATKPFDLETFLAGADKAGEILNRKNEPKPEAREKEESISEMVENNIDLVPIIPAPHEPMEWEEDWESKFDRAWYETEKGAKTLSQHRWSMKDVVRSLLEQARMKGKQEQYDIVHNKALAIEEIEAKARAEGYEDGRKIRDDVPMGVSQWKNHGDKWHYTEFWEEKIRNEAAADFKRRAGLEIAKLPIGQFRDEYIIQQSILNIIQALPLTEPKADNTKDET